MRAIDQTYDLNCGIKIPKIGLGTWLMDAKTSEQAVIDATLAGYTHIDTAQAYENEAAVGRGVRKSPISREDLFVVSKVDADHKDYASAAASIDRSLRDMGLDYLDMMMIHAPQPWEEDEKSKNRYLDGNVQAYRALEDALAAGKLRAIGVSNFLPCDIENILDNCSVVPAVNQVQCHVGHTPHELIAYCGEHDILVEAFSPVAHGALLHNQRLALMAASYHVSVAALCVRYCLQLGCVALPKMSSAVHMTDNANVDFVIASEDMELLGSFDPVDYDA